MNDAFEGFATAHFQLKQYISDPIEDFKANDLLYPLLWSHWGQVPFVSNQAGGGELRIQATIYVFDRLNRGATNWVDVMSDTLLIMEDFFNYFNDQEYETNPWDPKGKDFGFYFANVGTAVPVGSTFEDLVGGYSMPITVQTGNARNERQIPLDL